MIPAFEFDNPAELLAFYDDQIQADSVSIHPWQARAAIQFANPLAGYNTPVKLAVRAANGSGKDRMVIAPAIIWMLLCKPTSQTVITSSSGLQLDHQTQKYVERLARKVNARHGEDIIKIQYRHFECPITGAVADLFATDEAGKAEGWHPPEPGAELCIITNEGKSIDETIFEALLRCSGVVRRLDCSSPGTPKGYFYEACLGKGGYSEIKATAFDCPHLSKDHIESFRSFYGENSPTYRSAILAEFTSIEESVIITLDNIRRLMDMKVKGAISYVPLDGKHAGLDWSAGGDECVMDIWHGNRQIALEIFPYYENTTSSVSHAIHLMNKYDIAPESVNADDGGIGKPLTDQLWAKGYQINRVLNQSPPIARKQQFGNLGAEMWFNLASLIANNELIFLGDKKQLDQICSRYYRTAAGRIYCESKREARAKGHGSPDRADGATLAWKNYKAPLGLSHDGIDVGAESKINNWNYPNQDELQKLMRDYKESMFKGPNTKSPGLVSMQELIESVPAIQESVTDYVKRVRRN